ncbi:MAG: hypothetical protein AMJ70_03035 [Dehalococcoidia bacterium SG8_51_3]|nr:MAG: hypothetical protein AMJ70_03035 [Dehalococcoidia bacterium SG8_51_3]
MPYAINKYHAKEGNTDNNPAIEKWSSAHGYIFHIIDGNFSLGKTDTSGRILTLMQDLTKFNDCFANNTCSFIYERTNMPIFV